MSFPAAKLGALILKQVSKPIANACKNYAKSAPFFRKYICMPPAQLYHWSEVQMKMWILNLGKPVNIPVLNEQQAIELGASLLGEGILFAIAALILLSEYQRSAAKDAKKEAAVKAEKLQLEQNIQELYFVTQKQSTQINELMRHIYDLEGRVVQVPWKSKRTDDDDPPQSPPPPGSSSFDAPEDDEEEEELPGKKTDSHNAGHASPKAAKRCTHKDVHCSPLIGLAYEFVDNQLLSVEKRQTSIVNLGIDHLVRNVFQIPIKS